jgi:hypothetical protein
MLISNHLQQYKAAMLSLPKGTALSKDDLQVDKLLMKRSGKLEMYLHRTMNTLIHLQR